VTRLVARRRIVALATGLLAAGASSFSATGATPRVMGFVETVKGTEEVELRWPVAVATASAEEFAVADAFGPRLLRFRKVGVSWQLDGVADLPGTPVGLTWTAGRYVASLRQGQGLASFEGEALAYRRLPLPRGVVPGPLSAYPNGDLLVYDYRTSRALRLSARGRVTGEASIDGSVTALASLANGGFLAALAAKATVLRFDANGGLGETWALPAHDEIPAWPVGLVVEPGGDVVVVDRHAGRLLVLDASGQVAGIGSRRGWDPGLLLQPAGLARLADGIVVVADQGNGRVQLFRRTD